MKKKIAILGSTGSIGKSLIDIIKKDKKNYLITLLTANKNYKELIKQAKYFNVKNLIITNNFAFNQNAVMENGHNIVSIVKSTGIPKEKSGASPPSKPTPSNLAIPGSDGFAAIAATLELSMPLSSACIIPNTTH